MKRANTFKILKLLLKNKLVVHRSKKYDGYKLNYKGYDYLAINVLLRRGTLKEVTFKIGVGKESDIYICKGKDDENLILKLARLGRRSFRTIKNNRDYLGGKTQFNWLYLSRLASTKEFIFMKCLHENGFPTPRPVDSNRHAILMSHLDAFTVSKVTSLKNSEKVFHDCMDLIEKFAQHGLIHSDFNEFNIMVDEAQNVFVIDFPQMVSTDHPDAQFYFKRDVECIHTLFRRRFKFECERTLKLDDITVGKHLDREVHASGFYKYAKIKKKDIGVLDNFMQEQIKEDEEKRKARGSDEEEEEEEYVDDDDEEDEGDDQNDEEDDKQEEDDQVEEDNEQEDEEVEAQIQKDVKISEEKEEVIVEEKVNTSEAEEETPKEDLVVENETQAKQEIAQKVEKEEIIGNVEISDIPVPESEVTPDGEEEERELTEEEILALKKQEKDMKYIKKALRRKFKKKKKYKTNKNKTKEVANLNRDILF